MSLQLLKKLNGNKNGALKKFIDSFDMEPQIAWYPSAGEDFRDLLYLSKSYLQKNLIENVELKAPDIFIHTDYFPWTNSTLFDTEIVYPGFNTLIKVKHIEELMKLNLPLYSEIVDLPNGNLATNRVLFTILSIHSNVLGTWEIPLIYVFAENATFFHEIAMRDNAKFTQIINVRYGGGGGGGGQSSGIWIKNILKQIGCKMLLTDNHYFEGTGDSKIFELFPDLQLEDGYTLKTIRTTPKISWPGYNDISWQLVS